MTGTESGEALRAVHMGSRLYGLDLDDEALERVAVQWERLDTVRELLDACRVDENDQLIGQSPVGGAG